ncbi:MAG TPA: nuclear transport factor 2 family protein [Blastocatellia bacterium]|nr:nuclear transport factor 2 family protein [Blastocatellia bacterium]
MKYLITSILLLLMISTVWAWQDKSSSAALDSLVAAERAFSKTSVEKGVRNSFLEFFADDGIEFQPGPVNAKETLSKQSDVRPTTELKWEPVYADVAASGELGYTTGPYTFTDRRPETAATRYGHYFSIWKKQADGNWKVAVDCGIKTPVSGEGKEKFRAAVHAKGKLSTPNGNPEAERAGLLTYDKEFLKLSENQGLMYAYDRYLGTDCRMHRNGYLPFTDRSAVLTYLKATTRGITMKWWPLKSDVSVAGDLGYTYGSYEIDDANTRKPVEKGYYVRVWKRDANGTWNLVLDTTTPGPS